MAETTREFRPLGAFLAVQKAVRQAQLFRGDRDRHVYLDLLKRVAADAAVLCEGYCLLEDSVLAVMLARDAAGAGAVLKRTQTLYAGYLREMRAGRDRLWAPHIEINEVYGDDRWSALAYVENAPMRAKESARACDHMWSSARAHLGLSRPLLLLEMQGWLCNWDADAWELHLDRTGRDFAFWRLMEFSSGRSASRRKRRAAAVLELAQYAAAAQQPALPFVD